MYIKPEKLETDGRLQERSRLWWSQNPMGYDWHRTSPAAEGTRDFFREIDARFFGSSPFYAGERPFAGLIPFHTLQGKRVLEIGCGLGAHTQLLAEAGCVVTAIDLTPRAVELTKKRLRWAGVDADVRLMDAEALEFGSEEFDLVWSWGVIHHSASPERIVQQVHRVLKPFGEFRVMVYYRRALEACVSLLRGALSGKFFRGMSVDEVRNYYTDGYIARFYTRSSLTRLLGGGGLETTEIRIVGQKSEVLPLPGKGRSGRLKSSLLRSIPDGPAKFVLSRAGMFIFATAIKDPRLSVH
jgi:2-polyprenyl-3-methyl-5-hydroxy-6-metoxy-1,4-benzoquinol methylase